jgi:class 3 adenylate cyclase/pimeloyl-ACP methyl ester carboxylesterase
MDAPPVQYATTSDGVSIAWAEAGQGPALLQCLAPFSHVREGYAVFRAVFESFTQSFRLVTFDARGIGLSERDVAGVSAETLLLDARAVIDAAKLERFIVYAGGGSILALSTCLRLATAFPERVTHVVLECPYQNMRELADTPFGRTSSALAELDWTVYVQTLVRVLMGWDAASSDFVDPLAKLIGGWVDPSVGLRYGREMETMDVGDLLAQVSQPTLVLRHEPFSVPARCCQRVAAKIPGAQFLQYSDPTFVQQVELIRAFVAQSSPPPAQEAPAASPFRTVLFTDIVGHTEMMSRLGDERGREVLREHERITREVLKAHGGTEVKTMGDGFMASFGSVTKAVECAVALQRAMEAHNAGVGAQQPATGIANSPGGPVVAAPLQVRCGLNAGEPIEEDGDLFGATVILASRIAAKAEGGEILVADTVRGLCSGKGFLFADRGEFVAKGFEEPVRVYEVRWRE